MVDGKKIRRLREEAGVSADDLAKAVFVSQSMISYIESGIKTPSVELLLSVIK